MILRGITCDDPEVAAWLASPRQLLGGGGRLTFPLGRLVTAVEAPEGDLREAFARLPSNSAGCEAAAARLRLRGFDVTWGAPTAVADLAAVLERFEQWGRDSLDVIRADPALLPSLQVGSWFATRVRARVARRLALEAGLPAATGAARRLGTIGLRVLADRAFWRGVKNVATEADWRRLTVGYSVLLYHRLAGEDRPGQERIDVPAERFARALTALSRFGFRSLDADTVVAFHLPGGPPLDRRRFLVTIDDATRDCVAPLAAAASTTPLLFVPTGAVGGGAAWLDGVPVADWDELLELAALHVGLGGHGRTHANLKELDPASIEAETAGCYRDLADRTGSPPRAFAYPYGAQDERVRSAVASTGFRVAYTTLPGLNGAGTDPYSLRRVSVKSWDTTAAVAWKAITGEALPGWWEGWLLLRRRAGSLPGRIGRAVGAARPETARPASGRCLRRRR
jgi:peptidoglycan/xylan/chitin deacetylase (PgdA/CDA1 family)